MLKRNDFFFEYDEIEINSLVSSILEYYFLNG